MNRDSAKAEIKNSWRQIITTMTGPAKSKAQGEMTYICPICGHGTHGDGLKRNPDSKDGTGLKCFGCGWSGDIIDLYQKQTGADFNTALSSLAAEIGVEIDDRDKTPDKKEKPLKTQNTAPQDYSEYYRTCYNRITDPAAVAYLESRGISLEVAVAFNLGYDPAADPANAPGGKPRQNTDEYTYSPHPAPRIIIPVTKGHYVTRAITDDVPDRFRKLNNYDSTPGIFNLSALYDTESPVFITEGVFNALSFLAVNAFSIALNSASNVQTLLNAIDRRRPAAPLILCLDRDDAGRKAEKTLAEGLTARGIKYQCEDVTGGFGDNNDYLVTDRAGFSAAVDRITKTAGDITGLAALLYDSYTDKYKPVPTGIKSLDDLLQGGLLPGTIFLLGAEPGAGKTALCSMIFETMAAAGNPGIYLNLEMSREQLLARSISRRVYEKDHDHRLTALDVLQGYRQTECTKAVIAGAADEYRQEIGDRLQYNPGEIGADADEIIEYINAQGKAAQAAGRQASNICLDYLQIITGNRQEDAVEIIKRVVAALKEYAKNYNTVVFAIMAQSRAVNNLKEATLSAGRDSSSLEYTADYQAQLIRENDDDPQEITLYLTKSRFTRSSTKKGAGLTFHFNGAQSVFESQDWKPIEPKQASLFDDVPPV